ncbi:hypothetical protein [Candidatus Manganitrophus noduliformans]|uniref:Uncharacterized protein n=1 Tax=Candidatus Manganitrophus noduliformans TaxID=2606439 RepID=A0A7X6DUS2_9BACT|nr:hypothetical protein [Candidatus Manganitrophus noduliformans]NKE73549.1 hypothetical protein [Candidatus Manganitrophus noduliformans]
MKSDLLFLIEDLQAVQSGAKAVAFDFRKPFCDALNPGFDLLIRGLAPDYLLQIEMHPPEAQARSRRACRLAAISSAASNSTCGRLSPSSSARSRGEEDSSLSENSATAVSPSPRGTLFCISASFARCGGQHPSSFRENSESFGKKIPSNCAVRSITSFVFSVAPVEC